MVVGHRQLRLGFLVADLAVAVRVRSLDVVLDALAHFLLPRGAPGLDLVAAQLAVLVGIDLVETIEQE